MDLSDLINRAQELLTQNAAPVSLGVLTFNLLLAVLVSLVLRWHYARYATSIANREDLAKTFTLLILSTCLVITIVKSSLALSLGLVGALSIVRFRTPIKEPEELTYLYLAIAIGLGLGAGQTLATLLAAAVILITLAFLQKRAPHIRPGTLFLTASWRDADSSPSRLKAVHASILKFAQVVDVRRVDALADRLEMVFLVGMRNPEQLPDLLADLRNSYPAMELTMIDQHQVPGV